MGKNDTKMPARKAGKVDTKAPKKAGKAVKKR